jgi:hypothetical protein
MMSSLRRLLAAAFGLQAASALRNSLRRPKERSSASPCTAARSKAISKAIRPIARWSCICRPATRVTRRGAIRCCTFSTATPQPPEAYVKSLAIPDSIDRAVAAGAREMIVVIPDAFTKYSGSMFSNSPTIGDWETFIAQDLTTFIDKRYRTIASRETSRSRRPLDGRIRHDAHRHEAAGQLSPRSTR